MYLHTYIHIFTSGLLKKGLVPEIFKRKLVLIVLCYIYIYKTRALRTLWLDEPNFLSEYRDTTDVIFILY